MKKKKQSHITPEAKSFKEATGKLDNWLYHKRLTEYFRTSQNGKSEETE